MFIKNNVLILFFYIWHITGVLKFDHLSGLTKLLEEICTDSWQILQVFVALTT